MPPRKPKPWAPPAGLKIEIACSRGDIVFRSEATPAEALNVARLLTVLARKITEEAPDLLPIADTVPGAVLSYDWMEDELGGRKKLDRPPRVGF